jgi:hypothetical protein
MIFATAEDWITAVGTVATAGIAFLAAAIAAYEYRHSFGSGSLETYLKLEETAERPSAISARASVAQSYLAREEPRLDALIVALGGFERIAFAAKKRIITRRMVWSYAGDRILAYSYAFKDQIAARNDRLKSYWKNLIWVQPKLEKFNRKEKVTVWDGDKRESTIQEIMESESVLDGGPPPAQAGPSISPVDQQR